MLQITDTRSTVIAKTVRGSEIPANSVFTAGSYLFYKTKTGYIFDLRSGQAYSQDSMFVDYQSREAELIIR